MGTWQRRCWWGLAVLGFGAAAGLVAWLTMAHPEGSSQAWGVVGGVAGVAATVVALWQLRPTPSGPPPPAAAQPSPVIAENGGIAARGNVTRSTTRHTGPAPTTPAAAPGPPSDGITARNGGIAAGGDVEDSDAEYRP